MRVIFLLTIPFCCSAEPLPAEDEGSSVVILKDDFERQEADPEKEQIGNGWDTNSKTRAKGTKQADLVDGALYITRAAVADHGVSVTHEVAFQDATIRLRFKIGSKDDLGINIADMNEKSVHAGHICMARIRPQQLEIADLKTGRMNLATRKRKLAGKLTAEDEQRISRTSKKFGIAVSVDQWHQLAVNITGALMTITIDGQTAGEFRSEGIAHPTKSRLRLAVGRNAWVDDVVVVRNK